MNSKRAVYRQREQKEKHLRGSQVFLFTSEAIAGHNILILHSALCILHLIPLTVWRSSYLYGGILRGSALITLGEAFNAFLVFLPAFGDVFPALFFHAGTGGEDLVGEVAY